MVNLKKIKKTVKAASIHYLYHILDNLLTFFYIQFKQNVTTVIKTRIKISLKNINEQNVYIIIPSEHESNIIIIETLESNKIDVKLGNEYVFIVKWDDYHDRPIKKELTFDQKFNSVYKKISEIYEKSYQEYFGNISQMYYPDDWKKK